MMKSAALATCLCALAAVGLGQVLQADSFVCDGDLRGGICWLSDGRLRYSATWVFRNVPVGAALPLTLEGVAWDVCLTCEVGRDVLVRLYYRSDGDQYWQRTDLWLKNVTLEAGCLLGYTVRGQTRIFPTGPNLVVIVQRVLECDPHVGFSWASLTLGAEPVVLPPAPPPAPPSPTPTPPPPPPPPEQEVCEVPLVFECALGEPPAECLAPGLDLATVERQTLPESFGPEESAVVLGYGHYQGTLGEDDFQDWYRIKLPFGSAKIVWIDPGDLVLDVFIIHDPCGDVLGSCLEVREPRTLSVPCRADMECAFNDSGFCFTGPQCSYFIRIARRAGSGPYKLSILPATTVAP